MIIERSPNRPTGYADNLSLHVSSKLITLAGSSIGPDRHGDVQLGACEEVCSVMFLYVAKGT